MENGMRVALQRQVSSGSLKHGPAGELRRQSSMESSPRTGRAASRFLFGRQSSMDPNRRRGRSQSPVSAVAADPQELTVPDNLDATMQLLFLACHGDASGVEALLRGGVDVNSINLDGRTALHIAACEGQRDVVDVLLDWQANIDARDRWGSTAVADAKCYGHMDIYDILKSHGAKIPRNRRTPMMASTPGEIPEYELNPGELQFRKGDEVLKGTYQVAKWNGTKVSVKIVDRESYGDQEAVNSFRHELTVFEKVRHPNVVQFMGAVTQNIPMMIVSEYHPNGDLAAYIQRKGRLHGQKVLRYALDIARGMAYLHQCKPDPIIHCDLKPKNIFLDNGGLMKVGGFGLTRLSKMAPDKVKLMNHEALVDTFSYYTAPELYRNQVFDMSVDAYAFGFILYEMVEGLPNMDSTHVTRYEGIRPSLKNRLKGYPSDFKALIEECWETHTMARPTFSEIIIRLDKIYEHCAKQGSWKESLKIWSVSRRLNRFRLKIKRKERVHSY
ncbi:integrin-linked protein kinase 1-like isoform X1 [Lolium rigidum]|uniref:integrin-linked protein kinase 1-like isoform X1 n=1 Tax=Lolium rigidum TaxID=89674 RepID=UPI001F5C150D|nr:integrin-linked protein kinase 1-like isoform X1 [Lolium rigidum]